MRVLCVTNMYPTEAEPAVGREGAGNATSHTSDKIGAYRGAADFPLTVWHDGFVRATSFAAAESALP